MAMEVSGGAASNDRDQRLQSAKKKLKSYRAKQAQMEKAKRQSMLASTSSLSVSPTQLVGSVINDASHESQLAMSGSYNSRNSMRLSASLEKRHSSTLSLSNSGAVTTGAGHGRGHSRTGSISLSQTALADGVMAAALNHLSHPKASPCSNRSLSTHIANTTHSHTRGHSRSGSRSLAASRSRPNSFISGQKQDPNSWIDEVLSPAEELFKTPEMKSKMFLPMDAKISPQEKMVFSSIPSNNTVLAITPPTTSSSSHTRRPSRHARTGSVSTRRESMEIMGGLFTPETKRQSRRVSTNRWSGLQSASVLFGGGLDFSLAEKRRGSDESNSEDEGGNRLTALEKLEGKRREEPNQSSVQLPSFDDVHGEKGMDKRASLHLLEANAQSTSTERPSAPIAVPAARPLTMIENNKDLCIVIEEEEEEEDGSMSSPVKERGSMDFVDENEKRKRKEAEQEVIKRNRRGSLTPRPLKLKSRPSSLFVAPRSARLTASQSFPELCEEGEEEEVEQEAELAVIGGDDDKMNTPSTVPPVTPSHYLSASRTFALRPMQTPEKSLTPSKETKRAWRSSMPIVVNRSPSQSTSSTSPSPLSTSSSRQGMRALRLGSNSSTSSNASPLVRQHKNRTESTSSINSIASGSSSAFSKRGSMLYNASPISSTTSKEEVSLSLAKKRGSLMYKASPLDVALKGSADLSLAKNASAPASAPASTTVISVGGVPLGMFEELKSKHQRDVGVLDDARSKIARLEDELAVESDRRTLELNEMERWSAEEKRSLGQRIEDLEASLVQVVQMRNAKELILIEEREQKEKDLIKLRGEFEDVEAERDMLRDDVDGWRTRCSDLEKSLKIERRMTDDVKRSMIASRQRIRELLAKLQEAGVQVQGNSIDEEDTSSELIAILKSPITGPSSPPSQSQRDGSFSPIHSDLNQVLPPQAVQLLKDMRQQIFNLAGSLEHERKQHLLARQEVEELKAGMANSLLDETANTTMPTMVSLLSTPEKDTQRDASPSTSTPPHHSAAGQGSPAHGVKKKRNHVFAYDSSMESGFGSNEMGSGSVTTYQTSHDGDDSSAQAKDDEAFVARVQADLASLGMGTLGTVKEEESALDQEASLLEATRTSPRTSFDIESGRRASDVESVAPSTPALEHQASQYSASVLPPPLSNNTKEETGMRSSASSSMESHGPPSPFAPQTSGGGSSHGKTATPTMQSYENDEDSYEEETSREDRPEFIREWSFQQAAAAVQMKKQSPRKRPTIVTNGLRKKTRPMSIEDFFGIMSLDENQKLPPLPIPVEALEMPPLCFEGNYTAGKALGYGASPRFPSTIRPPVPKTSAMYGQSMSFRSNSTSSGRSSLNHQKMTSSSNNNEGGFAPGAASAASAISGGMFSRVASLTSAFSGYLIGNNSAPNDYDTSSNNTSNNTSNNSWAVTKREEEMA